jgi:hypothetical protein
MTTVVSAAAAAAAAVVVVCGWGWCCPLPLSLATQYGGDSYRLMQTTAAATHIDGCEWQQQRQLILNSKNAWAIWFMGMNFNIYVVSIYATHHVSTAEFIMDANNGDGGSNSSMTLWLVLMDMNNVGSNSSMIPWLVSRRMRTTMAVTTPVWCHGLYLDGREQRLQ